MSEMAIGRFVKITILVIVALIIVIIALSGWASGQYLGNRQYIQRLCPEWIGDLGGRCDMVKATTPDLSLNVGGTVKNLAQLCMEYYQSSAWDTSTYEKCKGLCTACPTSGGATP